MLMFHFNDSDHFICIADNFFSSDSDNRNSLSIFVVNDEYRKGNEIKDHE